MAELEKKCLKSHVEECIYKLKASFRYSTNCERYWIHETLLKVNIKNQEGTNKQYNLAKSIIEIIDRYIDTKRKSFESFINTCKKISELSLSSPSDAIRFVEAQLAPNVDARIFEIVSYADLKTK